MTFLAIIYTDLERGIAAGVIFSVFYFAFSYAKARGGAQTLVHACGSGGARCFSRFPGAICWPAAAAAGLLHSLPSRRVRCRDACWRTPSVTRVRTGIQALRHFTCSCFRPQALCHEMWDANSWSF